MARGCTSIKSTASASSQLHEKPTLITARGNNTNNIVKSVSFDTEVF